MESQEREQGSARSFWSLQSLSHYGRNLEGKHYKSREWRRVHVVFLPRCLADVEITESICEPAVSNIKSGNKVIKALFAEPGLEHY